MDDYNLAVGLYKQSRWTLASESFQKFLKENPQNPKAALARLYLGMSLRNDKKYDEARASLRAFIQESPNNKNVPFAMFRLAECSYFLDDVKAAENEFGQFIAKFPDHELGEWALPDLADVQLRLDKPKLAQATFQKAIALFPKGAMIEDSKFGLARALGLQGQSEEAVKLLTEVAANRGGTLAARAQLQLATAHFEAGRFDQAAVEYARVEQNFPNSPLIPLAKLNSGYAEYRRGDFRKAITLFDQAAASRDQATVANYWKGLSHKSLGEYKPAAAILKAALEADRKSELADQILFQMADCQLRDNQFSVARRCFYSRSKRGRKENGPTTACITRPKRPTSKKPTISRIYC